MVVDSSCDSKKISENGIDVTKTKDGGVIKVIEKNGEGEVSPKTGDTVYVHYVGTLAENGEKFDSSRDRGEVFSFKLGRGQVIKAWDLGLASMLKGELSTLYCRSDYAYGDQGSPPKIPSKADLVFQVELIEWTGEDISPDRDGSITKSIIKAGEQYSSPSEDSPVVVHAIGCHNGRVFMDKRLDFILGECLQVGLPPGVDTALKKFDKGEKAALRFKGCEWTYGSKAPAEFNLPINAQLDFELTLIDYEKVKSCWEMNKEEKISTAQKAKERGSEFFAQGNFELAIGKYKKVVELLEYEKSFEDEQKKKSDCIITAAHLNLSLIHLKNKDTVKCIEQCDKALKIAPNNVKARFRRAQALQEQNDLKEAIFDYKLVLEMEEGNKAAQQAVKVCHYKLSQFKKIEKEHFAGMFDKFAQKDAKAAKVLDEKSRKNAFPDSKK